MRNQASQFRTVKHQEMDLQHREQNRYLGFKVFSKSMPISNEHAEQITGGTRSVRKGSDYVITATIDAIMENVSSGK